MVEDRNKDEVKHISKTLPIWRERGSGVERENGEKERGGEGERRGKEGGGEKERGKEGGNWVRGT